MRVLLITNIPTPYRIPLLNSLCKKIEEDGHKFLVTFAAEGYSRRKWNNKLDEALFKYKILKSTSIKLGSSEKTLFTYSRLFQVIDDFKPSILIVSGFSFATLKIYLLSFRKRIKFIIWNGSITTKGRKDSYLRVLYRKLISKRAYGFIVYGSEAKKYIMHLGIEEKKIEIAINTVDTEYFLENSDSSSKVNFENGLLRLLYVGHFTKGKRLENLFHIVHSLVKQNINVQLTLVGDGPEQNALIKLSSELNIDDKIIFTGFKQKENLPNYFNDSDIFLFPSEYDVWGLVIVEAMASGVICIASMYSGAVVDLIIEGVTGYKVDFDREEDVIKIILNLYSDKLLSQSVGNNAKEFITNHVSIKDSVDGFIRAITKS